MRQNLATKEIEQRLCPEIEKQQRDETSDNLRIRGRYNTLKMETGKLLEIAKIGARIMSITTVSDHEVTRNLREPSDLKLMHMDVHENDEGHLPERRAQIQRREEFCVSQHGEVFIDAGNRVCVLYRYCVQVKKIAKKTKLPPFSLAMTTPQPHGRFDGSIVSYSFNIAIYFLHAFDLCGVIFLAPSL